MIHFSIEEATYFHLCTLVNFYGWQVSSVQLRSTTNYIANFVMFNLTYYSVLYFMAKLKDSFQLAKIFILKQDGIIKNNQISAASMVR